MIAPNQTIRISGVIFFSHMFKTILTIKGLPAGRRGSGCTALAKCGAALPTVGIRRVAGRFQFRK
jgi:hypothetical protein